MNNLYNNTIYLLDEFAPYRKLTKKEFKLKSKPWISNEILTKIHERDKRFYKYSNAKDLNRKINLFKDYKILRNTITRMKRDAKSKYYKEYFEMHKDKTASIWKGIRSIVKLKSSSKKDIIVLLYSIIDDKGVIISDQEKICNQFNNFFVNIGLNIDKTIPNSKRNFREYLHQIKVNKSFFLIPTIPEENFDIIISLDMNKSLGPNSVPIYILKVYNSFFF